MAGFHHLLLNEISQQECATLCYNRPEWKAVQGDVRDLDGSDFRGVDLLSGGVPCQPFSVGGDKRGQDDERDLFPEAVRLVREARPRAVLLENVPGLGHVTHDDLRKWVRAELEDLGYSVTWETIRACDHGVPQLRPRLVLVALQDGSPFPWPEPSPDPPPTVGDVLYPLMASRGWQGAEAWRDGAQGIAPTLSGNAGVTGGGPDLGQTRAKKDWSARLGVNALGIAEEPPEADGTQLRGKGLRRPLRDGQPMLTVPMTALLQGFPPSWVFQGPKTHAYRQVAEAFPPPVAEVLARKIAEALTR